MAGEINIAGNLVRVELENHIMPEFIKKSGKDYIYWGINNNYPEYLTELYNRHAEHGAIVKSKARYVYGKGLYIDEKTVDPFVKQAADNFLSCANRFETWNKVFKKITRPYELFNGFALQIIWKLGGLGFEVYCMEFSKFRMSQCGKKVYYCDKWLREDGSVNPSADRDPSFQEFPIFNPDIRVGTQILYYREESPYIQKYGDLYPMPEYSGAIADIETDVEISNFHYSNLKNGFTASAILSLFNGEPTEEDKKKIARLLKSNHTGSNNAGKIILNFNTDKGKGAEVVTLTASDLDKQFDQLSQRIQQKVLSAHFLTNPELAGIKTPGELGTSNDLQKDFELFYNSYIIPRQDNILSVIKDLGYIAGVDLSALEVKKLPPTTVNISDPNVAKYFTEDEIRKYLGYEPKAATPGAVTPVQQETEINEHLKNLTGRQWQNIKRLIREVQQKKISQEVATMMLKNSYGLNDSDIEILFKPNAKFRTEKFDNHVIEMFLACAEDENTEDQFISEEFVQFKSNSDALNHEFKIIKKAFDDLIPNEKKLQKSIIDLLKGDPTLTADKIAKMIGTDAASVNQVIKGLKDGGYIDAVKNLLQPTEKAIEIDVPTVETEIYTVYKYVTRPDVPRASSSRPFCMALLAASNSGKVWTREALDNLTNDIGEDAWTYRGGFYTNPHTGETTPYCRHIWKSITKSRTKK